VVSGLVEAARFNWAYQAELARTFLESHGIEAIVFDTQSNFYSDGAMVGVRLMVLDEEYDAARKLLEDYEP
jgi:Putative prokaryotic signal transducing protein